jgi:small subunit ribosomal protein S6
MAAGAPIYDLTLLLDAEAPEETRTRVLSEVERTIGSGGTLVGHHDWGRRHTAYPIRHKEEAVYHLFQFQSPPAVLETLQHTLRITDGVVRFRLIKLRPGTPPPPEPRPEPPRPEASAASRPDAGGRPDAASRPEAGQRAEESGPAAAGDSPASGDTQTGGADASSDAGSGADAGSAGGPGAGSSTPPGDSDSSTPPGDSDATEPASAS